MEMPLALAFLALSTLTVAGLFAAEPVKPFPGASAADQTRGLPADAFRPRLMPERETLEAYSFWMQLDDGSTLILSMLISNLEKPNRSALATTLYPPSGAPVGAHQEFDSSALTHNTNKVQFGRNSIERLADGKFRLRFAAPLDSGRGDIAADFTLTPTLPGHARGDGRIHYGRDGKRFELLQIMPRGQLEGQLTVAGKSSPARGMAYFDHTSQNLWMHHVAGRWFNYRFFSPKLFIATTSLITSSKYGSVPINHIIAADDKRLIVSTDKHSLVLLNRAMDSESGYAIPKEVRSTITGDGTKIDLQLMLPRYLDRMYLLENVNPFLRAIIRVLIARPYTYRYRVPATAVVTHKDGTVERVQGLVVADLIFVNE